MIIDLPKNIEDIVEPEALEEDYYLLRIVEEPTIEANKKLKEGGEEAPGAGYNLILSMRVQSDDPLVHGRQFKKWLGMPSEADKTDILPSGMTREDSKISMLSRISSAFSGEQQTGQSITLSAGMEAWCYVSKVLDQTGQRFVNELDFMQPLKPA